jgi:hypothetical protein
MPVLVKAKIGTWTQSGWAGVTPVSHPRFRSGEQRAAGSRLPRVMRSRRRVDRLCYTASGTQIA